MQDGHISFSISLIFHKFPTGNLAIEQSTCFIEFEEHFDTLKTQLIPHQQLAAGVIGFAVFVNFQAGVVVDVDLPMDDFSAAAALHGENVESAPVG
jgi:hypothetical protein